MGSKNRKPSAGGNRELPNSANKSPVEKAVRTEAKGGSCRPPGAAPHPMAFPSRLGGVPLGRGRKPGPDGEPPLLQQPASQPLGTEGCPRGSLVGPWVERMARGGDCVFRPLSCSLGHRDSEMKTQFLLRVSTGLVIALGNETVKALKTALLCPCHGDEVDLQHRLHCNLGLFGELCHVCIIRICFWRRNSLPAGHAHAQ